MKLGFFGGSFNPPTLAHYNLVKQALIEFNLDEVYFVPVNDYYQKANLINIEKRIEMLKIITKNDEKIKVLEIEKEIEKKLTTIDILELINQEYIGNEIYFLMGEDNYLKMNKWKDYDKLQKFKYIIFQRDEKNTLEIKEKNIIYMKNKENIKISSTIIRNRIKKNEDISDLVATGVKEYITKNNLYLN